jgi:hypothetical protein
MLFAIMKSCLCNYFSSLDLFWCSLQLGYDYDLVHPSSRLIFMVSLYFLQHHIYAHIIVAFDSYTTQVPTY